MVVPDNLAPRRRCRDDDARLSWSGSCVDVALSYLHRGGGSCLARALQYLLANLKNDNSTVSITNTGCIRRDNQCREQIDEVFLFIYSFPVCIGIRENHTGQIDSFLFFNSFQKEQIDLVLFFAAVFVT